MIAQLIISILVLILLIAILISIPDIPKEWTDNWDKKVNNWEDNSKHLKIMRDHYLREWQREKENNRQLREQYYVQCKRVDRLLEKLEEEKCQENI